VRRPPLPVERRAANPPLNLTEPPHFVTGYLRSSVRILFPFEPGTAHMELKEVQRHWDAFGKTDPLWAILTQPDKRHGKWKYDEFSAWGEEEIGRIRRHAEALAFPLRWGRALDFGCGAGRLTQALARHFRECDGVDIAPSMIALAQKYDRPWPRLRYEVGRL